MPTVTDTTTATHGRTSLKIALRPDTLPQLAFDYLHTGRTLTCARRTPVFV